MMTAASLTPPSKRCTRPAGRLSKAALNGSVHSDLTAAAAEALEADLLEDTLASRQQEQFVLTGTILRVVSLLREVTRVKPKRLPLLEPKRSSTSMALSQSICRRLCPETTMYPSTSGL